MEIIPSPHQLQVYNSIKNENSNLLIGAVAGSGKTTTIIKSLEYLKPELDVSFLAFNKSIVEHLKNKVRTGVNVQTLHSLGYQTLLKNGKYKLDKNKIVGIIYQNLKQFKVTKQLEKSFIYSVSQLVDFIRFNNCEDDKDKIFELALKHDILADEKEIDAALQILIYSNRREEVDFLDMLYLPVKEDLKMKRYDVLYIDEAQDMSIIQQKLFKKIVKPKGRFIAVGDSSQAIYGFAGSDVESFDKLSLEPNTKQLPLSVCYRCGSSIVRFVQDLVPDIQPFEGSEKGVVRNGSLHELRNGDWVLCRNTKPLFVLCLQLFQKRKKAYIKGHDFGTELNSILDKTDTDSITVACLKLDSLLSLKYDKLRSYGIEEPANTSSFNKFKETIDILKEVIFPEVRTISEAKKLIVEIFLEKDVENRITLSTIHRAKGFEADRIFVLKKDLMPSKYAKQPWQLQQERNLEYVCYTRARKQLIFILDFIDGR